MIQESSSAGSSDGHGGAGRDDDVYERLARHLGTLAMGLPRNEVLLEVLRETLTPSEAEISLLLPTRVAPLQPVSVDEIAVGTDMPRDELAAALEDMARRRLLFSGTTDGGQRGYALLQSGFGFGEQRFLWDGDESAYAVKMVEMLMRYFGTDLQGEQYAVSTKPWRYVPVNASISSDLQAVFPYHNIEAVVRQARRFAVAHCPCRMAAKIRGKTCEHPIEVCLKFDELADYLIERGLGREVSCDEALGIIKQSADAGLVHFVDNAEGPIKHNCNCCGCSCWNVGAIRRRKIARDDLMATYFMRTTDDDGCVGCGSCLDICPVQALSLDDGVAVADESWCIGCGLCAPRCPTGAAGLRLRDDPDRRPVSGFRELHEQILREKGLIR